MTKANVETVRAMYQAFSQGDTAAALALIDPDVIWDEGEGHPYGGRVFGRSDVVSRILDRFGAEWISLSTVPHELIDGGEYVIALGRDTGVCRSTGRAIDLEFAHVIRVTDGRVTSFKQYSNTAAWQQAML